MLNGLDLFSGIGGLALGLERWVRPIVYCEKEPYCQGVLLSRMQQSQLHIGPIWDDVRTLSSEHFGIPIDIITAGFPCQDISVAGNGGGLEGERSGLFFEIMRLASELRPSFIFLENVPAIAVRGLDRVLLELTSLGYDSRWTIVSAGELGAAHLRERWFLLAYASSPGLERLELSKASWKKFSTDTDLALPKTWLSPNSGFVRKTNELPIPVDEIRALGNSAMPYQAKKAFMRLMSFDTGYPPVERENK